MKNVIIGISDCSKYKNYEQWIMNESNVEVIKLSYAENNLSDLKKCHGILLSGGHDVHPSRYNKPENIRLCEPGNIDEKRDEFEWNVLEYAQKQKLPVLGICRGLQIANVFFGGTLIADIPAFGKPDHSKVNGNDRYHYVRVKENSLLEEIVGASKGEVNSAHHQSAESVAKDLVVSAISDDGIIEAIERKQSETDPFLMLVQWHPERMTDLESVFSKNIKLRFLKEARGQ